MFSSTLSTLLMRCDSDECRPRSMLFSSSNVVGCLVAPPESWRGLPPTPPTELLAPTPARLGPAPLPCVVDLGVPVPKNSARRPSMVGPRGPPNRSATNTFAPPCVLAPAGERAFRSEKKKGHGASHTVVYRYSLFDFQRFLRSSFSLPLFLKSLQYACVAHALTFEGKKFLNALQLLRRLRSLPLARAHHLHPREYPRDPEVLSHRRRPRYPLPGTNPFEPSHPRRGERGRPR